MDTDSKPGQNQSRGIPEEGKQIQVYLWRRSRRAQHQLHLQCIEISASEDFSLAVKALIEKDRRAFYAIKSVWPIKT